MCPRRKFTGVLENWNQNRKSRTSYMTWLVWLTINLMWYVKRCNHCIPFMNVLGGGGGMILWLSCCYDSFTGIIIILEILKISIYSDKKDPGPSKYICSSAVPSGSRAFLMPSCPSVCLSIRQDWGGGGQSQKRFSNFVAPPAGRQRSFSSAIWSVVVRRQLFT